MKMTDLNAPLFYPLTTPLPYTQVTTCATYLRKLPPPICLKLWPFSKKYGLIKRLLQAAVTRVLTAVALTMGMMMMTSVRQLFFFPALSPIGTSVQELLFQELQLCRIHTPLSQ